MRKKRCKSSVDGDTGIDLSTTASKHPADLGRRGCFLVVVVERHNSFSLGSHFDERYSKLLYMIIVKRY
jgi:hypothetical protein